MKLIALYNLEFFAPELPLVQAATDLGCRWLRLLYLEAQEDKQQEQFTEQQNGFAQTCNVHLALRSAQYLRSPEGLFSLRANYQIISLIITCIRNA